MAIEFDGNEQWDRVASELRAYKQSQQQAWGDVENTTLGRYLADDLSAEERQQIEESLTQLPELRRLTDLVRDVLDEFDPAAPVPLPAVPKILAFPPPRSTKKSFGRVFRQRGALLAAACVLLGLGIALAGRQFLMPDHQNDAQVAYNATAFKHSPWKDLGSQATSADTKPRLMMSSAHPDHLPLHDKRMTDGWRQLGKQVTTLVAATQEQVGTSYQQDGDYDRAASYLAQARDLKCKSLGDTHPDTLKTSRNLAQVYEVALNTATPASDGKEGRDASVHSFFYTLPSPTAEPRAAMKKLDHAYEKACVLRERLTRQNPEEVKQAIVPLLVHALRSAKTSGERQTCARALGALGPAAADAMTDLRSLLEKSDQPQERAVVAWALGQLGAAGRPAVPALVASLQTDQLEVRRAAGEALVQLSPYARQELLANARKEPGLPADLLARIEGPEGRSGVNDAGLLYSPFALQETQKQIQQLARKHRIEIYTETVAAPPAKGVVLVANRAKEVGANGIYLLICKEPPSVQIVVSEALQKRGFTPERLAELKKIVEAAVKQRQFDRGLLQTIHFIGQRFEKAAVGASLGTAAARALP